MTLTASTGRSSWDDVEPKRHRRKNEGFISWHNHRIKIGKGVVIHKFKHFSIQSHCPVNKIKGNLNWALQKDRLSYWNPGFLTYLCDNLDALVTSCILYISLCVILQPVLSEGWFPLSRNFYVRTRVKFTFANKIQAMYQRPHVSVKVEPRLT